MQRLAWQDGLSFSAACAEGLEVFARAKIHDQEETLFEPRFRKIAREENRALGNRLIFFGMRNAIAAEQTRILITDLYKRQLQKEGVALKEINKKLDNAFYVATFVKPFRALFASLVSYTTYSTNERILTAAASEVAVHLA